MIHLAGALVSILMVLAFGRPEAKEGERAVESVRIEESDTQFTIFFGRGTDAAFGIDTVNHGYIVHAPGRKGFRLRLEDGRSLRFESSRRELIFSWMQAGERQEQRWIGMDPTAWSRLSEFVTRHYPDTTLFGED